MPNKDRFAPTPEELRLLGKVGGYEIAPRVPNKGALTAEELQISTAAVPDPESLKRKMVEILVEEGVEAFARFAHYCPGLIADLAARDPEVVDVLVAAYKYGIDEENAICANDLGSLYYLGSLVPQDYAKAAELYELAMDWGSYQSVINLGYIYEYGRTGERDPLKAFAYYSLAAALEPSNEAIYKLGDMYARGKAIPKDMRAAYDLWMKALDVAQNIEEEAQAAIRIAPLLLDPEDSGAGVQFDPLKALFLYQKAEVGLRISIGKGQHYYARRLEEALVGQETARAMLEIFDISGFE